MILLITGGSGRLGNNLTRLLLKYNYEIHCTSHTYPCNISGAVWHKADITSKEEISKLIKKSNPDTVIHTSAITNLELCENNKKLAYEVNVEGTKNIVNACKETDSKIVYVSTSNVFSGEKNIYYEDDIPQPSNHYAFTKLIGENTVSESGLPFLILRTDQLYFWTNRIEKKTFVERVLDKLIKNELVEVFVDWYNTPTLIPNFSYITSKLIKKNKCGIYHIVGPDYVNRHQWALEIANVFGQDKTLIHRTSSSRAGMKAKRGNVHLSNTKVTNELGVKLLGIKEGLNLMKERKDE
ncbi:MAG: SDR family oxidoreductase [Promethearchaeota archaeon]